MQRAAQVDDRGTRGHGGVHELLVLGLPFHGPAVTARHQAGGAVFLGELPERQHAGELQGGRGPGHVDPDPLVPVHELRDRPRPAVDHVPQVEDVVRAGG